MPTQSNAALANALQQVIARVDDREGELIAWQSGSATGGPSGDGLYPLTNLLGDTVLVKSPALLQQEVDQLTSAAGGAVAQAEAARDTAQAAQASASTSAQGAATSAAQSSANAALVQSLRDEAANSEANALAHRDAVTEMALAFASVSDVPSTPTSPGTTGEFVYDSNHIYVCVADNTWKRAALATW